MLGQKVTITDNFFNAVAEVARSRCNWIVFLAAEIFVEILI